MINKTVFLNLLNKYFTFQPVFAIKHKLEIPVVIIIQVENQIIFKIKKLHEI